MKHNFTFYIYSKFDIIYEPQNSWFKQNRLNFEVSLYKYIEKAQSQTYIMSFFNNAPNT